MLDLRPFLAGHGAARPRARRARTATRACGTSGRRLEAVLRRLKLSGAQAAAIGDDEPDIPMFEATALSACPSDAAPAARKAATVVLESAGGRGAVREFIELILARNGQSGIVTHRPG